jgi:hypothetical protein
VRKNRDLNQNPIVSGVSNPMLRIKAPVAIFIMIDNRLYPEIWAPAEDAGIVGLQLSLAATSLGLAGMGRRSLIRSSSVKSLASRHTDSCTSGTSSNTQPSTR